MKDVTMASGVELKILDTPFGVSNRLFKAVMKTMKAVEVNSDIKNLDEFISALLSSQLSDDEVEAAMWLCLSYCTYGGRKIIPAIFDEEKARKDYIDICLEVGQENLAPFMKALFVALPRLTLLISSFQKPK